MQRLYKGKRQNFWVHVSRAFYNAIYKQGEAISYFIEYNICHFVYLLSVFIFLAIANLTELKK